MGIKIYFLAFLLVYVAQRINASSEYELEASNKGVEDQLKKLLEQLQEAVEEATKLAEEQYEKLSEMAKADIESALKALNELSDETKAEIEKLKEEVTEVGEAARACVEAQLGNVEALEEETRAKITVVSTNFLNAIKVLIDDSLALVKASADIVKQYIAEFNNCENVICKLGVISRADVVQQNIRTDIVKVKQLVATFIMNQLPATRKELGEVIVNYQDKNAVIVGQIRECIDNIASN